MKWKLLAVTSLAMATSAFADQFVCRGEGLKVTVKNHVHAAEGTRKAAVLILVDTTREDGDKTLAVVKDSVLKGNAASSHFNVQDAAEADQFRVLTSEEKFLGHYIDEYNTISVRVKGFKYGDDEGDYDGLLTAKGDRGVHEAVDLHCAYSKKNQ